ncbi:MAG: hypothetical protein Kow0089_01700 [Desulfobulbaceae bacterium]
MREVTNLLFDTVMPAASSDFSEIREEVFNCGGCTGLIKFRIEEDGGLSTSDSPVEGPKDDRENREQREHRRSARREGVVLSGQLSEIPPSELLQFFHMHQKTGKLVVDVPGGTGRVAFRDGAIIGARFLEYVDKEAIFALLREREGRFSFINGIPASLQEVEDIGDFMMLLMEGIKRLDEQNT